ncbi:MAG: hypothetical protein FWG94_11335 [Oscillospiraceae bacterium]|nr:hypothetical protein [Oscillospiraceae bacterium]
MIEYIGENIGFFLKVVFTHVITYCVCGMIAYKVNNYKELLESNKWFENWRSQDSLIFKLSPVIQIFRGILFGIVLLIIKDVVIDTNFGFLKLFLILAIIGLFNVYSPAPASIEGFIYIDSKDDNTTLRQSIGSIMEILIQILIFSIIVCTNWTELISGIFN